MIGYQNCGLRLDTVIQCVVTVQLTYSVIRFRLSAEFRSFWPKFGFAEIAKSISVSVSVSAETNVSISNLPKLSELLLYKPLDSLYTTPTLEYLPNKCSESSAILSLQNSSNNKLKKKKP